MAHCNDTTIIVSTHYMSEAQKADFVAFMRNGKLLVEKSPRAVLEEFKVESLDEVFQQLSLKQQMSDDEMENSLKIYPKDTNINGISNGLKLTNVKAFLWKNILLTRRNLM